MIPKSAVGEIKLPKASHRPMRVLTDEQLDKFMEVIQEGILWYDFFCTELTTGLRRGGICGLKQGGFDKTDGVLKVCRTIHQEREAKQKGTAPVGLFQRGIQRPAGRLHLIAAKPAGCPVSIKKRSRHTKPAPEWSG